MFFARIVVPEGRVDGDVTAEARIGVQPRTSPEEKNDHVRRGQSRARRVLDLHTSIVTHRLLHAKARVAVDRRRDRLMLNIFGAKVTDYSHDLVRLLHNQTRDAPTCLRPDIHNCHTKGALGAGVSPVPNGLATDQRRIGIRRFSLVGGAPTRP